MRFKAGDTVELKSGNNPFWMTITRISDSGLIYCRFGSAGGDAGGFREHELQYYSPPPSERLPSDRAESVYGDRE